MRPSTRRFSAILWALFFFGCLRNSAADTGPPTGVEHDAIARAVPGATLENFRGEIVAVLYGASSPPARVREERHGGEYDQTAFLYMPRERNRKLLDRRVTVHYRTEDTATAHRLTRLIARLLYLYPAHLGRPTAFPRAQASADVWLNSPLSRRYSDIGGETWTNQVYLFQTAEERKPIEWVRTLLHEWGHLTLPAARGFSAPENDAGGYLGERLFFKWLREDTAANSEDLVQREDLDLYYSRQINPLIREFHAEGPASSLLNKDTVEAMDYYTGVALAADEAFGSLFMGKALFSIERETPRELIRTLRQTFELQRAVRVRLPAWVPLEAASYTLAADAPGNVRMADRPAFAVGATSQSLSVLQSGWKWIRASEGDTAALTFQMQRRQP